MNTLSYETALTYIENTIGTGVKSGLQNMIRLLERLGNPHLAFPTLHVAGTNGKGSVCAFLQAALRCAGYKTGLYSSPYLQKYNERIRINGILLPNDVLGVLMEEIIPVVDGMREEGIYPTVFEIGTALAFQYFAHEQVDIAVIEAGLGGRLDSTNVVSPLVCGITSIGLDHVKKLGDNKASIAAEKAGIAKPGVPLVLCSQVTEDIKQIVQACCEETGAPFFLSDAPYEGAIGLLGKHQHHNASVAISMLQRLRETGFVISDEVIFEGIARTRWPGRLEWLDGKERILLDGAHNPQAAQALLHYFISLPRLYTVLLFGIIQDKDWQSVIHTLSKIANIVVTVSPDAQRGLDPSEAANAFNSHGVACMPCQTVQEGLQAAKRIAELHNGRIIVSGSLYLVGQVRTLMGNGESLLLSES